MDAQRRTALFFVTQGVDCASRSLCVTEVQATCVAGSRSLLWNIEQRLQPWSLQFVDIYGKKVYWSKTIKTQ